MFVQCSYNGQKFVQYCTNFSGRLYEHCTNFFGHCTNIVRTLYEHCKNMVRTLYGLCIVQTLTQILYQHRMNVHRPAIYHPYSAENIKLSIPIAYNVLSEFQSLEYASARFSFLCGLFLTEKNRTKCTLSNVTNQAFACPAMHVSLRHVSLSMVLVCTLL